MANSLSLYFLLYIHKFSLFCIIDMFFCNKSIMKNVIHNNEKVLHGDETIMKRTDFTQQSQNIL